MAENKRYTEYSSKDYVNEKMKHLPIENNYTIFEDAVPSLQEEVYIFNNLQNEDMIPLSVSGELIISFNDGTEDITKTSIFQNNGNDYSYCVDFIDYCYVITLSYSADTNSITVSVQKEIEVEDGWELIPCTVTKGTFVCSIYSNLLKNYCIESVDYEQIDGVPNQLQGLVNGRYESLDAEEYNYLYDNSFVWDMNKINERLDENSGVTQNTTVNTIGGKAIQVNQKDSEGIGFGQFVPINNKKNVGIFVNAGDDVIIKVYNPNTKELILTMKDNFGDSFKFAKYYIASSRLKGIDNIFVAFTINDNPTNFDSDKLIQNLIITDESTFLKKEEILTKTNTKEYTPTDSYHPATKKYVDDAVSSLSGTGIDEDELNTMLTNVYGFTDTE